MSDPFDQPVGTTEVPSTPSTPPPSTDSTSTESQSLQNYGRAGAFGKQANVTSPQFGQQTNPSPIKDLALLPVNIIANVMGHIPTGWVPGGADEKFRQMGDWMKTNDPAGYGQWQIADAAANADPLGGGEKRATFTREWGTKYIDQQKDMPDLGIFKNNPGLALSPGGSLGQGFADAFGIAFAGGQAIQGKLGEGQNFQVDGGLGTGGNNPHQGQQQTFTRIGSILERQRLGLPLNPLESEVVNHLNDGSWSEDHALAYLVRNGSGLSRDPLTQIIGGAATDPMTYLTLAPGLLIKAGKIGEAAAEATRFAGVGPALPHESLSGLQKAAMVLHDVQQPAADASLAARSLPPIFKVTRSLVDPFSIIGHDTATRGLVDLAAGGSVDAMRRAYGEPAYNALFNTARELGITAEVQSALGGSAGNGARTWIALSHVLDQIKTNAGGEQLFDVLTDSAVDDLLRAAPRDAQSRLADFFQSNRKLFRQGAAGAEDDAQLAARMESAFGKVVDVSKMSEGEKSLWHMATYEKDWIGFTEALAKVENYQGAKKLHLMVMMNDNQLDNVAAQNLRNASHEISQGIAKGTHTLDDWFTLWDDAVKKYGDIADLGKARPNTITLGKLEERLTALIDSGRLHTRATPDEFLDPALKPVADWLASKNIDGRQLWNIGFRPDDFHAWGMRRDPYEGRLMVGRNPFASHVQDATPAALPVNDVVTNFLGHVVGVKAASALSKPVEALEVALRTASDVVSGQRLITNMEQRFIINMSKHDISATDAKAMFRNIKEAANLQQTTLQGIRPTNAWKSVEGIVKKSGLKGSLNQRVLMNELLDASNGDLRIIGLTSGLSQRIRTRIEAALGDKSINFTGDLTVNGYRNLRYAWNPTFYGQKVTDAIYFNILDGNPIAGAGRIQAGGRLAAAQMILDNMGDTGLARNFSFDMREFQFQTTFQQSLRARLAQLAPEGRMQSIAAAGSRLQQNNMYSHVMSGLGNAVKESLDEARATLLKIAEDPALSPAEQQMALEAANSQVQTFGRLRQRYSAIAGRVLNDEEVGLAYVKELRGDAAGLTQDPVTGLANFRHDIAEGTYQDAGTTGVLQSVRQDYVAADLGYDSVADLHHAIEDGDTSIEQVLSDMRDHFNADPAYLKRLRDVLSFNYADFWRDAAVKLSLERGEITALQNIIARDAQMRGMTSADYLAQVLPTTAADVGIDGHLGALLDIVRGGMTGDEVTQAKALSNIFIRTLDPSAQRLLVGYYRDLLPQMIQDAKGIGTVEGHAEAARLSAIKQAFDGPVANPLGPIAQAQGIAQDAASFLEKHPNEFQVLRFPGAASKTIIHRLGDGLLALPPEQQQFLLSHIDSILEHFPNIDLTHIDVPANFHLPEAEGGMGHAITDQAVHVEYAGGKSVLYLSPTKFGPGAADYWAEVAKRNEAMANLDRAVGRRVIPAGTGPGGIETPLDVVYHELAGHGIDTLIRPSIGAVDEQQRIWQDFLDRLDQEGLPNFISRYAKMTYGQGREREWVAELLNVAFNPAVDKSTLPLALRNAVEDVRSTLEDLGHYVPSATPDFTLFDVGMNNEVANQFADQVAKRASGLSRMYIAHANPDVEAVAQQYSKWLQDFTSNEFLRNRELIGRQTAEIMDKVPTDQALQYHRSEALVQQLLADKIKLLHRNAFKLAEMSTERTVASRTLNHPLFALYPTSYMWGKVFPRMARFLGSTSFGLEGGQAGYQLAKVEQSIAAQREFDPKFDSTMKALGNSETAFLLDYITPSLPWSDMRASPPPWLVAAFKAKGLDLGKMTAAEIATIDPSRWLNAPAKAGSEVLDFLKKQVQSAPTPAPTTEAPTPTSAAPTGPAGELTQPLGGAFKDLQSLFQ